MRYTSQRYLNVEQCLHPEKGISEREMWDGGGVGQAGRGDLRARAESKDRVFCRILYLISLKQLLCLLRIRLAALEISGSGLRNSWVSSVL